MKACLLVVGLFLFAGSVTAAPEADASLSDTVYRTRNGTMYHRADCKRLRFSEPIARAEAVESLEPCPVCHPDQMGEVEPPAAVAIAEKPMAAKPVPAASTPAPLVVTKPAKVVAPVVDANPPPRREAEHRPHKRRGSGPLIGAVVGGGVGFVAGFAAAVAIAESDYNSSATSLVGVWAGGTVAGIIGGYALGGGFSNTEAAFAAEQERFRLAHAELEADSMEPPRVLAATH